MLSFEPFDTEFKYSLLKTFIDQSEHWYQHGTPAIVGAKAAQDYLTLAAEVMASIKSDISKKAF